MYFLTVKFLYICISGECSLDNNKNNNFISRGLHIWPECQSNLWSSISKVDMSLIIEQAYISFSMYRAGEVSVHRACCEWDTWPYTRGGDVRFVQAQDQQVVTTCIPKILTECLLIRLMLMHVHGIYSGFRAGAILSIRKYEFI